MELAVITGGFLPIPATKGGAVENLVVNLLNENEKKCQVKFTVFSIYDKKAVEETNKYKHTKFIFIKTNPLIGVMDRLVFFIAKNILKKKNSHSYRYIIQRLSYLNSVSKYLKKGNYDKVLLENHPTQYLALKWRKNYKKYENRYYYHCHNELPGTYGCRDIIKNTQNFICVSNFIKQSLMTILNMSKDKFEVLRNCIDIDRFSGTLEQEELINIRKKYNIKDNDKILLFTGRIVPEKGIREIIDALKKVKYKNYKLLILGSALNELKTKTEYQEQIETSIKEIKDKVIFTGYINYGEINKFYTMADIAILPSIWDDPAPLTIIESLASGLPIITTNSGGIPEYAVGNSAIILNKSNNLVENLAITIDKLLNDDKKCREMSLAGKNASLDLTLQNYYKNFLKCLK